MEVVTNIQGTQEINIHVFRGIRIHNPCNRAAVPAHLLLWPYSRRESAGYVWLFMARQPPVGQKFLIHEVSRPHTTTDHSRQDSSGWVISPSQRPLPEYTQHSQHTDIHASGGIRTHNLSRRRPQTYGLDRAVTETGVSAGSTTKSTWSIVLVVKVPSTKISSMWCK